MDNAGRHNTITGNAPNIPNLRTKNINHTIYENIEEEDKLTIFHSKFLHNPYISNNTHIIASNPLNVNTSTRYNKSSTKTINLNSEEFILDDKRLSLSHNINKDKDQDVKLVHISVAKKKSQNLNININIQNIEQNNVVNNTRVIYVDKNHNNNKTQNKNNNNPCVNLGVHGKDNLKVLTENENLESETYFDNTEREEYNHNNIDTENFNSEIEKFDMELNFNKLVKKRKRWMMYLILKLKSTLLMIDCRLNL